MSPKYRRTPNTGRTPKNHKSTKNTALKMVPKDMNRYFTGKKAGKKWFFH